MADAGTLKSGNRWRRTAIAALLMGSAMALAASPARSQQAPGNFAIHATPRPVPPIQFWDGNGKTLRLADFRGRVILLNLWATWCAPCRLEMPTLDRLQAALGGPGFEVVALSIDRAGSGVVQKFFTETGVRRLSLYIDFFGKAATDLNAAGLPTTLLIDRAGQEIGRLTGAADWDTPEMILFLRDYISEGPGDRPPEPGLERTGSPDPRAFKKGATS